MVKEGIRWKGGEVVDQKGAGEEEAE